MATWHILLPIPKFPGGVQPTRRCQLARRQAICHASAKSHLFPFLLSPEASRKFRLFPSKFPLRRSFFCRASDRTVPDNYFDSDDESNGYISEDDWKLPKSNEVKQDPLFYPKELEGPEEKLKPDAEFIAKISPPEGRISRGVIVSLLLFLLLLSLLLTVDAYIWKIIRRPLSVFYLSLPFLISSSLSLYLGFLFLPLLRSLKLGQILRKEGPKGHLSKGGTPTMGGLTFLPAGILTSRFVIGYNAPEVNGVIMATLLFAGIGLLDDILVLVRKKNDGLPGNIKFFMQVAVGLWFYFWIEAAPLPTPYVSKLLVCLPPPFVWLYGSHLYLPLTVFTCAAVSNGVNLTDGLDGLAAGTCALSFLAMAVAVMPVYPAVGAFGAAMAGACVGFLGHNRNKASMFMGDTGSLALGGSLAAMAAISGMFLPLFITSFVFVVETISVILQVGYFKLTKQMHGTGKRIFKMTPFHHHLELSGWSEVSIVILGYFFALIFAVLAAYVGLISA